MSSLLLPNEILSLSSQTVQRLLDAGDGDCALLYLALLRDGGEEEKARLALRWDGQRYGRTCERLAELGLIHKEPAPPPAPSAQPRQETPEYTQADVNTALEGEGSFRGLADAVEDCLGRRLSPNDLKILLGIYDDLALPPEVILTMVQWCVSETERRQGKGRRPRMSDVKRAAFRWKREGVETAERAEEFLRQDERLSGREREILPLLDIRDRAAVAKEREYLSEWVRMGFEDDAIRLAYERTLFRKQQMNWAYMNSILKRWHQAGWHTAAQAEAEDKPPQRAQEPGGPKARPDFQPTAERIQKNADWLDEFLRSQEGG